MKEVFVVTSGSYSDYGVDAIFSTKEFADEWVKYHKGKTGTKYYVGSWKLDPTFDISRGYPFVIIMDKSGNLYERWDSFYDEELEDNITRDYYHQYNEEGEPVQCLRFYLHANDEEHAIKIANEKRLQLIAGNQWDTYFNEGEDI